ncbi:MAG: helix-turn-helix transcriptional regulator [Limisphaerales bacterium]
MVKSKAWMLNGDQDTANRTAAEQCVARPDHAAEAELLDKAGVARLLQVSRRTVDNLRDLPRIRLSRRLVRYPRRAVLDWIGRRTVGW